jgi:phage gpG-like protein
MKFTLSIKDGISPKVDALLRKQSGAGRKAALAVMGMVLRDWAMEAFTDASKRPAAWKAKADGTASTLQGKSPVLRGSLRVEATAEEVTIGTDRKYALIHQVGGVITAKAGGALRFKGSNGKWVTVKQVTMPARPYLPVMASGAIMPAAGEEAAAAVLDEMTAV